LLFPALAQANDALADAQHHFYSGRYAETLVASESLTTGDTALAAYELRTSAWLFQLRRALGDPKDKEKAYKACAPCPEFFSAFMKDFAAGREAARAALKEKPGDPEATFFLGKLDLNYVWLMLGTLGRKTGWNEYWEARHSMDAVLASDPDHLRARVARAWIDYIVDTRMPWGTGWLLGGGNKKHALVVMQDAAKADPTADPYASAEALFGLWDMQMREKNVKAAIPPAVVLAERFPQNVDIAKFVAEKGTR
jgi:hypothetical protein